MISWSITYADGQQETVRASDLRAALMVLPGGRPAGLTLGHPDDVVRAEVVPADGAPTFTRQELVTIALALEEFRDTGVPELAERVNGVLRGPGDAFRLAADR